MPGQSSSTGPGHAIPEFSRREAALSPAKKRLLHRRLQGDGGSELLRRLPFPRPDRIPVSDNQRRLWVIQQLDTVSTDYHVQTAVRFRGELNVNALDRALASLVARHEALRTHFVETEGEVCQVIDEARDLSLTVEAIGGSGDVAGRILDEVFREEALKPFDLTAGPLFRVRLLRFGPKDHVLIRTAHHIVTDGWSEGILHRELLLLYEAFTSGREPLLPPLAVQYSDFALWQRARSTTGHESTGAEYWRQQLAGAPEQTDLLIDESRRGNVAGTARSHVATVGADVTIALKRRADEHRATLFMVLLAAFAVVLSKHSDQNDILVGTPVADRPDPSLEGVVGFFVNTLALRMRMLPRMTLSDLLAQVRRTVLEAYQYQDVPFDRVVRDVRAARNGEGTPLVQVLFALQNAVLPAPELGPVVTQAVRPPALNVRFDIEVHVSEENEHLVVGWLYRGDLFEQWRIAAMARHLEDVLRLIAVRPSQVIESIPWVETRAPMPAADLAGSTSARTPLPDTFIETVKRAPDAVALQWNGCAFSVGSLARDVCLLDSRLRPTPVAAKGDLYLHGRWAERMCRSRSAAEVAARLVASPYGRAGARMLRVGSGACWREDGTVQLRLPLGGDRRPPTADVVDCAERAVAGDDACETLAALFGEVLNLPQVPHDKSFFALGGDSIGAIQLAARGRKVRLSFKPTDVFLHQTVQALARVAQPLLDRGDAALDYPEGDVPLTPIMYWMREHGLYTNRFSQSTLLEIPAGLSEPTLIAAVQAVIDHHDALRCRLETPSPAEWRLTVAAAGTVDARRCARRVDVAALGDEERNSCYLAHARGALDRLDPSNGQVIDVVLFDAGTSSSSRLLLVVHHVAIDGVSWRTLISDLASACRALESGREPALEPKTTSFRSWARLLVGQAASSGVREQLQFWRHVLGRSASLVPSAVVAGSRDTFEMAGRSTALLPPEVTGPLLTTVPQLLHGDVRDVLLTALALSIRCWQQEQGIDGRAILVDVEGHGRDELPGIDLGRTVGWFTSLYPVLLDIGLPDGSDVLQDVRALANAFVRVKEHLRSVPGGGRTFGILRYLNADTAASLSGCASPQVCFNYLGRIGGFLETPWRVATEEIAGGYDPSTPLPHALTVNATAVERPDGPYLVAQWCWAPSVLSGPVARRLAALWNDALRALVRYAGRPEASGRAPSDVPLTGLSRTEIRRLEQHFGRT